MASTLEVTHNHRDTKLLVCIVADVFFRTNVIFQISMIQPAIFRNGYLLLLNDYVFSFQSYICYSFSIDIDIDMDAIFLGLFYPLITQFFTLINMRYNPIYMYKCIFRQGSMK